MLFLVATNVVASRPPERRLTGTPHARAKSFVRFPMPTFDASTLVLNYQSNKSKLILQ